VFTGLTIDCVIVIANVCQTVGHSSMNKVHIDAVHHCVLTSKSRTTLKLRILDPCLGEALNSVHSHFLLQHLNFGLESHNS
jgi:hypothetical protein